MRVSGLHVGFGPDASSFTSAAPNQRGFWRYILELWTRDRMAVTSYRGTKGPSSTFCLREGICTQEDDALRTPFSGLIGGRV